MKSGDLLWINHYGDHPAVVIDVYEDGKLLVVCGTGTDRPTDPTKIRIHLREQAGLAWGLTKPTYFYASKIAVVKTSAITRIVGKSLRPPSLFHKFEALVQTAAPPIVPPAFAPVVAPAAIAAFASEPASAKPSLLSTTHLSGAAVPTTKPDK